MAKNGEEARLKTPKQRQGWPKILHTARKKIQPVPRVSLLCLPWSSENTTKMKNWKILTAKCKCTREHILGHDWFIKIT